MFFKKNYAFTLFEVLITLTIIGIITILTLPALDKIYQRNTTQTTFSDTIKTFNQALFTYSTVNTRCNGNLACTGAFANRAQPATAISSVFQRIVANANCWDRLLIYQGLNMSNPTRLNNYDCFIDNKNIIYAIQNFNNNCTTNLANNRAPQNHKLTKSCGYLYFDVNGDEIPNTFGIDIFVFAITNSAPSYLYPVGGELWQDTTNFDNIDACNVNNEGRTCAGRIIQDGMKIRYWQ